MYLLGLQLIIIFIIDLSVDQVIIWSLKCHKIMKNSKYNTFTDI